MEGLNIAIWRTSSNETELINRNEFDHIHLHINFWHIEETICLDIGIKFSFENNSTINIYFDKCEFNKDSIEDLSEKLSIQDVRNAIFNEFTAHKTCPQKHNGRWQIANEFCTIHFKDKFNVKKHKNGTLITIPISNSCKQECKSQLNTNSTEQRNNEQYVRFRIKNAAIDRAFVKDEVPASKLDYYTSQIELIDFRINNKRVLSSLDIDNEGFKLCKINSMRCFFMMESADDLMLCMEKQKSLRSLEKDIWKQYIDLHSLDKKTCAIIAYQWNEDKQKDDFSLFLKIKKSKFLKFKVLCIIIFLIAIGVISSLIASWIYSLI